MLKRYLADNQDNQSFPSSIQMYEAWRMARNNLASNLGNPQLRTIKLYDLSHYFGTHFYRKARDILATKEALDHSRIETTLVYTKLICFNEGEFICKVAENVKEASALIEEGFEYVMKIDGVELFRKPK
jgi:site-specific recombinase XerC